MPSALTTRLALTALACAISAAPAQAQGGLLRKMKQKAAEVAGQKAAEKAAEKAGVEAPGQRSSSFTPAAPKFDDRVVEITDARITGMVKALGVERTEAERRMQQGAANRQRYEADKQAYAAKHLEYQKTGAAYRQKSEAYARCMGGVPGVSAQTQATHVKMATTVATADTAELRREQQHLMELNKRAEAAKQRGDRQTMAAIMDTVQTIMTRFTGVSQAEMSRMNAEQKRNDAAAAKCADPGPAPVEPEPPTPPGDDPNAQRAAFEAAAKASGLTPEQYAVMRERLAYIVGVKAEFRSQTAYAYSSDEIAAVKKRLGDLAPYEEQLQMGGTPTWQFEGNAGNAGNESAAPRRARPRPR